MRGAIPIAFSLCCVLSCSGIRAADLHVEFAGETSEHTWLLKDLDPHLPADWSGYNYLVLELKSSTPQRFFLKLDTTAGPRNMRIDLFGQDAWIRATIPLKYFEAPDRQGHDLASLGNKPRNSFWLGPRGPYGPLNEVRSLGIVMEKPVGNPTLDIRVVKVAKDDPGSEILEPKPVMDAYGQWIPADWPGKIKDLAQLQREWKQEEDRLAAAKFDYCPYGGYLGTKARATGFFRVEQIDGKWWFIDPDGHYFFSTSANGMRAGGADTPTRGRESYFAELPPLDIFPALPSAGGTMAGSRGAFTAWNLYRRFGQDWQNKWRQFTIRRMDDWGLNTVGNWSDPKLWDLHKKAYIVFLRGWGIENGYMGMPDVYSEDFPRLADRMAAEQCEPRKNDPYLLGYFIGNEPPWPGRESLLADTILEHPGTPMYAELKKFLEPGDTPERRKQFAYRSFERFISIVNAAVRRHDPNHLNLGLRFGGSVPAPEIIRASRAFDVYSLNVYDYFIKPETLSAIFQQTGRPILVGEFHNGVPGRGLSAGLVQVANQAERGIGYRYYVEQAAAFPAFVGASWFEWWDEPVTGRMDGENYNIGLVDVTDRPYSELVNAMKATHKRLLEVHAGKEPPFSQKPKVQ